jgi:hypothetical protein
MYVCNSMCVCVCVCVWRTIFKLFLSEYYFYMSIRLLNSIPKLQKNSRYNIIHSPITQY